ncbi:MAG: hypothetical protein PHI97_01035 [Desulfobulbus sp.]|nr:hypothetical protein [Desulfobulbus sp.]
MPAAFPDVVRIAEMKQIKGEGGEAEVIPIHHRSDIIEKYFLLASRGRA